MRISDWSSDVCSSDLDLGRAHFLQNYMEMMYELLDLGGRSSLMIPAENQWNNAAFGPWFEKLNNGPNGKARDRIKIGRVIRDLCITAWGGRMFMYENFNGTPLYGIIPLTMPRADTTGAGNSKARSVRQE